ncbi:succinyl-CoA--3-ketoacid-CoA transferase [Gordonia spumicola]|uniref:Succinyl-CoA--3-ketoacid-CoA transferase n=1 Tax=Gordonia spumicola TaxID=589161 RepID=A0A7I9V6W0_9ACTN|nr:CoA transferase subunit A [Gordonia spumicola]GEE00801.1 succinyl-CoA--3-ketoacid-CoA transferase [Gordonia spumicola]GEE04093.1 succinyl-CoA--3-ketoacid-CoA transferase [Gordonia spumicola]
MKLFTTAIEAVAGIGDGASIAVGGFGVCGVPDTLIEALVDAGVGDLDVYSNNCGVDGYGLGLLLSAGRIARITASYVGENREFARAYLAGDLEVHLTPQGTLAERLRAGGAGLPAFYTPAGVGTPVADGGLPLRYGPDGGVALASEPKETRVFGDRTYVMEESIVTDVALVHAEVGDTDGNLVFAKSAMNFNPLVAMAGRVTIAQVEKLVEPGDIGPAAVHLPGVFVQRVVCTGPQAKRIEKRTVAA